MNAPLLALRLKYEPDVVSARQRARHIAELLGFDRIEQTRLATALSEVARNAFMYAGGGTVTFSLEGDTPPQLLVIEVADKGPGIRHLDDVLSGQYHSSTGLGIGLAGARRLVDRFDIDSSRSGTRIRIAKLLPSRASFWAGPELGRLADELARQRPEGPLGEVQEQNRELLSALEALQARQQELERVNRELEDTNRGVVALYAELDERADHLRRADELKTRFLSNMTHEFRTPLNSILALSRLLAERLQIDDSERNELHYIRKSAQQLSDLVDDLLDIAKVEAGKVEVRPVHFEVAALFGALRGMLRPLLLSQSLALVFEDPADLPPLYSDETKISQILRNFISNALKYTDQGEVRVSAELAGRDQLAFRVTDTGIGIPEEDLPRIFDEFVQIENPLQRRVKGTGLGLPLSRRLAELLGGTITATSSLGAGSTFTLTVPLVYRQTANGAVPLDVPAHQVPVLVVEDSDQDLLVYQRVLANTRFHVVSARTADQARQVLRSMTPAAVILDIRLNGQEAWDLLIGLKRESATSEVPVIVASSIDDRRKAFGLGASAVTVKPVDGPWLVRTLESLMTPNPRLRVLAIDDEEAFRFIIRETLNSPQYELAEASSGEEALVVAHQFRPDVILLDLNLPDMSGYELSERLTADRDTAHVPQVVVTSERVSSLDHARLRASTRVLPKSALSRELLRGMIRDAVRVAPLPAA